MITLSPSALFNLVEQNLKQRQTASTASSHPSGCGCPLCTGAAQSGNNLGLRLPSAVRQVVGRGSVLQGIEADATFGAGLLASPAFAIPTLTGSAGSHVLVGGVGNEVLVGGRGSDLLLGGFDSAKQTDSRMLVDADVAAASAHDASVAAGRGGDATYDAIFADWGNDFRAPELWT